VILRIPQPLSVYKEVIHSPVSNDRNREPRRQHPLNNNNSLLRTTILSWWRNRRRQSSSSRHNHDEEDEDDDDGRKESVDEVKMRVAITIALPSPEYPVHIKNNNGQDAVENNNMERQKMTDYCIGTYECPWH